MTVKMRYIKTLC